GRWRSPSTATGCSCPSSPPASPPACPTASSASSAPPTATTASSSSSTSSARSSRPSSPPTTTPCPTRSTSSSHRAPATFTALCNSPRFHRTLQQSTVSPPYVPRPGSAALAAASPDLLHGPPADVDGGSPCARTADVPYAWATAPSPLVHSARRRAPRHDVR